MTTDHIFVTMVQKRKPEVQYFVILVHVGVQVTWLRAAYRLSICILLADITDSLTTHIMTEFSVCLCCCVAVHSCVHTLSQHLYWLISWK